MGDDSEKRRTKRIFVELPVRWVRRGLPSLHAQAADINLHGLFVQQAETLPVGSLQRMEVDLPDGPVTMAVVVRFAGRGISGAGVGVEVHQMAEPDQERWTAHYERLLARTKTR